MMHNLPDAKPCNLWKEALIGVVLACICAALICPVCLAQSGDAKGSSPRSVDIVHLSGGDSGYPTPFMHYPRGPGIYKMNLIFDCLIERDDKGLIPWLAESWDISSDGKEYTFHLRDDVNWADGEPFTAEDVRFTIEYEKEHSPASAYDLSLVLDMKVIDEHTIKFILSQPMAPFLDEMASVRIIPQHIWEKVDDPNAFDSPEAVIGTGPYTLEEYNKEHGTYRFAAKEDFWGPTPRVKSIEFVPVSDATVAFQQGAIDFVGLSADLVDMFKSDPEVYIFQQPAVWGYELTFNMAKNPILKDKAVRQAFAYAIDREELVEKIGRGAGKPGSMGILPQDHIWYNPDLPEYEHNAEKAMKILEEDGWKDSDGNGVMDKDGQELSFDIILSSDQARIGELVKERLKEAGISVSIQAIESKSRDAKLGSGDFEIGINGYGGWGFDADYLRAKFCGESFGIEGAGHGRPLTGYQNDRVDELCLAQLGEIDEQKRKEIVYEIQEVLAEDVPSIPLYYTASYNAYRPAVYDGWMNMFDHHEMTHSKLSYLDRSELEN
ncbi:MAG: ABC transporter substrate-binding protein [Methanothrix sp.]|uniref:ABC transporter substrate-binding protein n=2 Tax=Methanothrix sp. TaxID=90426 RepID=UPI0032AE9ECA